MPNVDFTLEDVKNVIKTDVQGLIAASETRMMKHMDARFEEAREATIDLVGTVLDQLEEHNDRFDQIDARFEQIDGRFDRMDARFDRMDARFENLESEFKTTNRLVRQHSLDIMELRAN